MLLMRNLCGLVEITKPGGQAEDDIKRFDRLLGGPKGLWIVCPWRWALAFQAAASQDDLNGSDKAAH